jgi:ATP-dependent DNA helicase RecG
MTAENLERLLERLVREPRESEVLEFKSNYLEPHEIGKRLSALANSASLLGKEHGYLVFGVEDSTHAIQGTTFTPKTVKIGTEELERWLLQRLNPRIDVRIHEFEYKGKHIALFIVPATFRQPVLFETEAYIRVGSITTKLREHPEKERTIWQQTSAPFEHEIALADCSAADVVRLLDCQAIFEMFKLPFPQTQDGVLEKLLHEGFVRRSNTGFAITNLGAVLFAKKLRDFETLRFRTARVITYKGNSKLDTVRDYDLEKGYANGFQELMLYINAQLPANEEIGKAFRREMRMYPEIAIRELVANAIIHQDFRESGSSPRVEIYADRIEITNPGLPLIETDRFIDEDKARNEVLADLMRKFDICEKKGSGVDKTIAAIELFQLPAPSFLITPHHTKSILYAPMVLNVMDKNDKIRACYQHCCLRYVLREPMNNQSLRQRFQIEEHNYSTASRIIKDTMQAELIKVKDEESKSRKFVTYLPFWA